MVFCDTTGYVLLLLDLSNAACAVFAVQVDVCQRRIQALEAQLQQQQAAAGASHAVDVQLQDASARADRAEAAEKGADERASAAQEELQRLRDALDAKVAELQRLELAMGELTYEAETARGAELRSRQLQVHALLASCSYHCAQTRPGPGNFS